MSLLFALSKLTFSSAIYLAFELTLIYNGMKTEVIGGFLVIHPLCDIRRLFSDIRAW